jgi:hypothetical protein
MPINIATGAKAPTLREPAAPVKDASGADVPVTELPFIVEAVGAVVLVAAGGVVGSATPLGQCQWSP